MTRKEANNKLIEIISTYLNKYPNIRFGQALVNIGIIDVDFEGSLRDPFYDESEDILKRL